ncbi:hypothetical protein [Achromobacter kerstersii]|uniref:Uncharacterized protein n=1 Tax=Achromobacter kerstersii TaxID=1353890 RepID=A0A6S7BP27_9BURK|nr:hypothetical protein [Achromobacter kerstersii]CAB3722910.1 hypothetical protein LMG3441_03971 [Achromobacter kerstersii]
MNTLPFFSIDEAKENALALNGAFQFYSLSYAPTADGGEAFPLGLQRTQELVAGVFGFERWSDLIRTLAVGNVHSVYSDSQGPAGEHYRKLTIRLSPLFSHEDAERRVYAALSYSAFGRCPTKRKWARRTMRQMPCKTVEQWHELQRLEAGYSYVTRYRSNRTAYEAALLRWEHEKNVAQLLGNPLPRKPRKPQERRMPRVRI